MLPPAAPRQEIEAMERERARRRLFIHAGTHKTGSTSIQETLFHQMPLVAGAGVKLIVDHPHNTVRRSNSRSIAHAFIRDDLWTLSRMRASQPVRFGATEMMTYLESELRTDGWRAAILSSETFCYMRTRNERRHLETFLARFDLDLVPIVYFRKDRDWRASWEDQIAKHPRLVAMRQRHPERFAFDWYFDRESIVAFWRGVSPEAVFLDYDKELADRGSVVPSFLEIAGLPPSLDSEHYFLNRRSGRAATET
jgi:hypothetical protein